MSQPCMICSLRDQHHGASSTAASTLPSIETTLGVVPHLGLPLDSTLQGVGTQKTAAVGHTVDSRDTPGKPLQAQDGKRDKPDTPRPVRLTQRQRRGESWLGRLRLLPDDLFAQVLQRLQCGTTAKDAAKWLLTQPNRGGCQHLSYNSLRLYLQYLRAKVLELDKQRRKQREQLLGKLADGLERERERIDNVMAINAACEGVPPEPPKPKTKRKQRLENMARLREVTRGMSTRDMYITEFAMHHARAEMTNEAFELETGLLVPEVTKAGRAAIAALDGIVKLEHNEIERMKANASVPVENSAAIDGDPADPRTTLAPTQGEPSLKSDSTS